MHLFLGSYALVASFMGLACCSSVGQGIRSGGLRIHSSSTGQWPWRPWRRPARWGPVETFGTELFDSGQSDCMPEDVVGHPVEVLTYRDPRDMRYNEQGSERCFMWLVPQEDQAYRGPLPVVVFFPGVDTPARQACHAQSEWVRKAPDLGYALICADPNRLWHIPKYVGNHNTCSDHHSPEFLYVKKILQFIQRRPEELDSTKVYFVGHSRGAMIAGWAGACFSSKIRGLAQVSSGLKLHGKAVEEELCALHLGDDCVPGIDDGIHTPMADCEQDDCQFFPARPSPTNNIAGELLPRCLMAGCDDSLRQSVDLLAVYLQRISMPYTLLHYDGGHSMPDNIVASVVACVGIMGQHNDTALLKNHTCANPTN